MLEEYLLGETPGYTHWNSNMSGVNVCQFDLSDSASAKLVSLPVTKSPSHFEALFCQGGYLLAELSNNHKLSAEAQAIFLLSDPSELRSFKISGNLRGILVTIDEREAKKDVSSIFTTIGVQINPTMIKERMETQLGCAVLSNSPWSIAVFEYLACLPEHAQGQYSVLKTIEMLYLLCKKETEKKPTPNLYLGSYVGRSIAEAHNYMETHLSEKLTISVLSRKFSISPTSLKSGFRTMYGQPIHRWLMAQRMKRASDLIHSTNMTIQQIAQEVGYDGVSQFNTVFKQHYGQTPGQAKKMSKTGVFRPF